MAATIATEPRAKNARPRAFGSNRAARRATRPARRGRSGCSRVPAGSTRGLNTRPGLLFLNNRYHDPTLGAFISVDPLVTMTGEAYIYASGNPVTWSDPTGLETFGDMTDPRWIKSLEAAARSEAKGNMATTEAIKQAIVDHHNKPDPGRAINEHLTIGYSGCLFVCVGATYQDGHLMPSLGEFGFSARVGPTIGWATKPPDEREDASIGGSLTYIVGTGGKLGVWSEEPKSPGVDYEQYFNSGLGFSFGPAKTWSIKLW